VPAGRTRRPARAGNIPCAAAAAQSGRAKRPVSRPRPAAAVARPRSA